MGSIWSGRKIVACEDALGYLTHFAPVFVTRKPDGTFTEDKREYELFREEGAAFLRSKEFLDAFPEDDWQTSFFVAKRFDSLLTWLEQNCS